MSHEVKIFSLLRAQDQKNLEIIDQRDLTSRRDISLKPNIRTLEKIITAITKQ